MMDQKNSTSGTGGRTDSHGGESTPWLRAFTQLKSELVGRIESESRKAVDVPGSPRAAFCRCLDFLARTITGVRPEMAVTLRAEGAEKAVVFVCLSWTDPDRRWLDTFATFDHRTSCDQKIVWVPSRKDQGKLQEMYRSLQTLGCSPALREVLRKNGPTIKDDTVGQYIWFWNDR